MARAALGRPPKVATPEQRLAGLIGGGAAISTTTSVGERLLLFDEAQAAYQTGRFLEVGSYLGATAAVLAEVVRRRGSAGTRLFCVDTWQNDAMSEGLRDTWAEFQANTAPWSPYITTLAGDSRTVASPGDPGSFDLVFIDGDHTYEGARADVDRFANLVRTGGRLVMHDHAYYNESVGRVVGELLGTGDWVVAAVASNILSLCRVVEKRKPKPARAFGEAVASEAAR